MINKRIEELRNRIIDCYNYEPDPKFQRRLEEYHKKIEDDFQEEWSKKKFKWFFKNRRQVKLKAKIFRRYQPPIFLTVEDALEDVLPKAIDSSFVWMTDIKDVTLGDKNYLSEENLIDKINSFGCTSFMLTPDEIKQLEFAEMIDCNNCPHLSITEEQQDYLKKVVGKSALYPHLCMKYEQRVYHWGDEPMVHPCQQCKEEREE